MADAISNQVAALTAILERMERQAEEDRKAFSLDRAKAELARSAVSAELADFRHGQNDVLRRLSKIEPITDLVTSVRSKVIGGVMVLGVIGGVAWGGIVFFKEIIMGWFQ